MPKMPLRENDAQLESEIIQTLLAGLKDYRPDLHYPESHSDMQACVRGLLCMYEIKRRPLAVSLKYKCPNCEGLGHLVTKADKGSRELKTCDECNGKGYIE